MNVSVGKRALLEIVSTSGHFFEFVKTFQYLIHPFLERVIFFGVGFDNVYDFFQRLGKKPMIINSF